MAQTRVLEEDERMDGPFISLSTAEESIFDDFSAFFSWLTVQASVFNEDSGMHRRGPTSQRSQMASSSGQISQQRRSQTASSSGPDLPVLEKD